MKRIFFALGIFIFLLFTFNSCMSAQHLGHANQEGRNYSNFGGGSHSDGCH